MVKNPPAMRRHKRREFDLWIGKISWRRGWQPTAVFLPGEPQARSMEGYSPWGCRVGHDWATDTCTSILGRQVLYWITREALGSYFEVLNSNESVMAYLHPHLVDFLVLNFWGRKESKKKNILYVYLLKDFMKPELQTASGRLSWLFSWRWKTKREHLAIRKSK